MDAQKKLAGVAATIKHFHQREYNTFQQYFLGAEGEAQYELKKKKK